MTDVKNIKDSCAICQEDIDNFNDLEILKCNHKYHYDCIRDWFVKIQSPQGMSQHKKRECPYCRVNGNYLKLRLNETPIKGVHKEYKSYNKFKNGNKQCKAITRNKTQCLNIALYNGYCGISSHKKNAFNICKKYN